MNDDLRHRLLALIIPLPERKQIGRISLVILLAVNGVAVWRMY